MRINYVPIFPALWAIICAVNILITYDYYMMTENGRLLLFLFAVMMVLCALLTVYLAMPDLIPRLMQRISPGKRCLLLRLTAWRTPAGSIPMSEFER